MLMRVKTACRPGSARHSDRPPGQRRIRKGRRRLVIAGPLADPPDRPELNIHFHGRSPGSRIEPDARLPDFRQWHDGHPSPPTVAGAASDFDRLPGYPLARTVDSLTMRSPASRCQRDIKKSLYPPFHSDPTTGTELHRNPLTRIPNENTTSGVSWSPGSQGWVIIGKPVRAIAPVRRCPRNCDSRRNPASQIPATTG